MRNAELISHIHDLLVAELQAAGADITPLTLGDLESAGTNTQARHQLGVVGAYRLAVTPEVERALKPLADAAASRPQAENGLQPLHPQDQALIDGESFTMDEVLLDFEEYIESSCIPTPTDQDIRDEEEALSRIPSRFRPGSRDDRDRAELEAQVAFYDPEAPAIAETRHHQDMLVASVAARFVPADFEPQGTTPQEVAAERSLAGWGALRAHRNELVLAALAAGVTKTRIAELTGMSRATIDRIPGVA